MKKYRANVGLDMVETSILIGLIVIAAVGVLSVFGGQINQLFVNSSSSYSKYQPFSNPVGAAPEPIVTPTTNYLPSPTPTLIGSDPCKNGCPGFNRAVIPLNSAKHIKTQ